MRSAMLPPVALSFLYRLARRALQLLRLHRLNAFSKDAEILVRQSRSTVSSANRVSTASSISSLVAN
jgi:hypothetical protein